MGRHVSVWVSMCLYGSLWVSMVTVGPYGSPCVPIGLSMCLYGSLWVPMGLYVSLWVAVGPYGSLYVSLWVSVGPYGSLWVPVGRSGSLWVAVGPYGSLCVHWLTLLCPTAVVPRGFPGAAADPGLPHSSGGSERPTARVGRPAAAGLLCPTAAP